MIDFILLGGLLMICLIQQYQIDRLRNIVSALIELHLETEDSE